MRTWWLLVRFHLQMERPWILLVSTLLPLTLLLMAPAQAWLAVHAVKANFETALVIDAPESFHASLGTLVEDLPVRFGSPASAPAGTVVLRIPPDVLETGAFEVEGVTETAEAVRLATGLWIASRWTAERLGERPPLVWDAPRPTLPADLEAPTWKQWLPRLGYAVLLFPIVGGGARGVELGDQLRKGLGRLLMLDVPASVQVLAALCLAFALQVLVRGGAVALLGLGAALSGGILLELAGPILVVFALAILASVQTLAGTVVLRRFAGDLGKHTMALVAMGLQGLLIPVVVGWGSLGPRLWWMPVVGLFSTWDAFIAGQGWWTGLVVQMVEAGLLAALMVRLVDADRMPQERLWVWLAGREERGPTA